MEKTTISEPPATDIVPELIRVMSQSDKFVTLHGSTQNTHEILSRLEAEVTKESKARWINVAVPSAGIKNQEEACKLIGDAAQPQGIKINIAQYGSAFTFFSYELHDLADEAPLYISIMDIENLKSNLAMGQDLIAWVRALNNDKRMDKGRYLQVILSKTAAPDDIRDPHSKFSYTNYNIHRLFEV
jgi:hypothetical protein